MAGKERTAMERRKWDPKQKALIVLQGLKGKPIADICAEHQITQSQYYLWSDQFLAKMHTVFVESDRKEQTLTRENARLKKIIGDLTIELKKTEEWLR
jgi:transposase-like protein